MKQENLFLLTVHASVRCAQRGIRHSDLEILEQIGTEVDDGYFIRERDYRAYEHAIKQQLERARRLVGKRFVVQEGRIVTAYRATRGRERHVLRNAEQRALAEEKL
jgi:hypothetical protein